jgi:hypothetical protein
MLAKDDAEHPVPPEWRATFHRIADAFAVGDYELCNHTIANVSAIDRPTAEFISGCVAAYGDSLTPLHPSTWERAIYHWTGGCWTFLVDLTTTNEQVSDLTLHAKLYDTEDSKLEVMSVHVP